MRSYELVVLLHPDLEIDVDASISKLEKMVDNTEGKVVKRDNWGKKRLAYRLKGQDFAVYVYFELLLEPAKVPGFERNLLLSEEVMRHILVVKEVAKTPAVEPKKAKIASLSEETNDEAKEESDGAEF